MSERHANASRGRGPGQPQIGTQVKATIADADLAAIDEAIGQGRWKTRSQAMRDLVHAALSHGIVGA